MDTDTRKPTRDMLITALHKLQDHGAIRGFSTDKNDGVWEIGELDGTERTFQTQEALDNYLQTDHNMVALFRPVAEYKKEHGPNHRRAVVKRDTNFIDTWMVSKFNHISYYDREYYEGHEKFSDVEEAKEFAQDWVQKESAQWS